MPLPVSVPELGVNLDHIATIRQARRTDEPDPLHAIFLAEEAGADGITLHLREDRRHIQDRDVDLARQVIRTRLNLECGLEPAMVERAVALRPERVCLVPERREEITTEGGLDVDGRREAVGEAVRRLADVGVLVSLFIDPEERQIDAARALGAPNIELHTGRYAEAWTYPNQRAVELAALARAARHARASGLHVHAGHGLTYPNVGPVAALPEVVELNIGHSIISRAVMTGLPEAVRAMKQRIREARAAT